MLHVCLFVCVYITGVLGTFVYHPAWAFFLYQMVYFFYPQGRWWGGQVPSLSYSFISVVLMLFGLILHFKIANQNKILAIPQFRWLLVFLFFFSMAGFYAVMPDVHSAAAMFFVKLVVIVLIAYKLVDTRPKLDGALVSYVAGASYIGLLTYQTGRNSGDRVEGVGTVDSPESNGIAAALVPAAIYALYFFWVKQSKYYRVAMLVAGAFIANALVLINSRGAFIATIAGAVYFLVRLYFSRYQRRNQKTAVVGLILAGILGAGLIVDESTIKRFKSISETDIENTEKESGATRMYFWLSAIDLSYDYPFGLGFRGYEVKGSEYLPEDIDTGGSRHRAVHSTWAQSLSEVGYPGTIALLMMLFASFSSLKKCRLSIRSPTMFNDYYRIIAIEASFFSYLIAITFINRLTAEILYWLVLFSACSYNVYILKEGQRESIRARTL